MTQPSSGKSPTSRDSVETLLHSLFVMNPLNAHQTSHIVPLTRIYGGSIYPTDLSLFSLFEEFERNRLLSSAPSFNYWNAALSSSSSNSIDALTSLNPAMVMRTCVSFSYDNLAGRQPLDSKGNTQEYDPRFLVALLSSVLAGDTSQVTHVNWVAILRTNVASVVLRCMASRDKNLRETAYQSLYALGHSLKVRA